MDLKNDSEQLRRLLEEPESVESRSRERLRAPYIISIGHFIEEVAS